ncbi:MAG: ABC transporter permease subunit [Deinococcota bacterium]
MATSQRTFDLPLGHERIPFYRNVKILRVLSQLVFLALIIIAGYILVNNVRTAIQTSNLRADFGFLVNRAGIPISETPIQYDTSDNYGRAMLVGLVNTLKIALIGVALATLLGITVGVMGLSQNWLLRNIAVSYVEVLRNTPLAVQIVFWFTAVLTPVPPRASAPLVFPGGIYLSNVGIAFPWLFRSYRFAWWVPGLILAVAAGVAMYIYHQRQLTRADQVGNPLPRALGVTVAVAALSYTLTLMGNSTPADSQVDFLAERGRGTAFVDANGNSEFDDDERHLAYLPVTVSVAEGRLSTNVQNITEGRRYVYSSFRFPLLEEHEYTSAEVSFADEGDAARYSLHFTRYPSIGTVYEDRNGNNEFDVGENLDATADGPTGLSDIELLLTVQGFSRRVTTDRVGQLRTPIFESPNAEEAAPANNMRPGSLFSAPAESEEAALEVTTTLHPAGPLVLSRPTLPISGYVGGVRLSTSYLALLLALVVYTASFIAEIVRAGILAVPKGQGEAAKSLGLNDGQTFRLVVFPQAMRVILPPLISEYLNLTKNSSLAPLAGYAEIFSISVIVANQSGASIPAIMIIMVAYLTISLLFAFVLNTVNARMALVER